MKKILNNKIFPVILLIIFCFCFPAVAFGDAQEKSGPVKLTDGWCYRWGDSPAGEKGIPQWILEDMDGSAWTELDALPLKSANPLDFNTAWFRLKLPENIWENPSLYFELIYGQALEFYIGEQKIYETKQNEKYNTNNSIVVLLPPEFHYQYLYIRTNSANLYGPASNILIGNHDELTAVFNSKELSSIILGCVLMVLAFMMLLCSFFLRKAQLKEWVSLSILILSYGIWIAFVTNGFSTFFPQLERFRVALSSYAMIVSIISFGYFFEQLFGSGPKNVFRLLWKAAALYGFLFLVSGFIDVLGFQTRFKFLLGVLFVAQLLIIVGASIYYAIKGNRFARMLTSGFVILALPFIIEIILALGGYSESSFYLWKWGILGFVIVLVSIFGKKLAQDHDRLIEYAGELRLLSDKLLKMDKLKDDFFANTSHELRTPLHGIIGLIESMLEEKNNPLSPRQVRNLSLVASSARRLMELVNEMLDFSRLKNQDIPLTLKTVNVWQVAEIVLALSRPLIKKKNIAFINLIQESNSFVVADENRLRQILYNLIGNAVKFTQEGSITISADEREDMLEISVSDTGIGIPEENIEDVFKPFVQLESSETREHNGTGLGLYITKKLVEMHGGEIRLESALNKGSKFTFSVPGCKNASTEEKGYAGKRVEYPVVPVTESTEDIPDTFRNNGDAFSILIADDEPVNLQVLENILMSENYNIVKAENGKDVLDYIRTADKPDLVILDVMMPKISGYNVCRKLRETYSYYDLPIIIITAKNLPDDIIAGFEAGANDYISKPFYAGELKARIKTLIELKTAVNYAIRAQLYFLQSQIKPHFLHNTLNTIKALNRKNPEKADDLIMDLSNFLRESFNFKNMQSEMPIEKEINIVKSYLKIEMVRFPNKLNISYDIDENVSCDIPPLIFQPIVENAVKHGVLPKRGSGSIKISVKGHYNYVLLTVEDDGVGIQKEKIPLLLEGQVEGAGIGISNIHKRMKALYGTGVDMLSEINKGTTVNLYIPKKQKGGASNVKGFAG